MLADVHELRPRVGKKGMPVGVGRERRRRRAHVDDSLGGEDPQLDTEDEDQDQAEPERRQRVEDIAEDGDHLVDQAVALDRGQDARQRRDRHPQDPGSSHQDGRRGQPLGDQAEHRLARGDRIAEVPVEDAVRAAAEELGQEVGQPVGRQEATAGAIEDAQPAQVFLDRLEDVRVADEAPALEPGRHLLGRDVRVLVEGGLRPAGGLLHQQEAHHRDQPDHGQRLDDPSNDELHHVAAPKKPRRAFEARRRMFIRLNASIG